MPISREEAAHVARLARLDLAPDEFDHLAGQLDQILDYVAQVSELAADVPATSHAISMTNVYRDDVPEPCLDAQAALAGAPAVDKGRFQVPRILGEDE